jgi:hypothetical protein
MEIYGRVEMEYARVFSKYRRVEPKKVEVQPEVAPSAESRLCLC